MLFIDHFTQGPCKDFRVGIYGMLKQKERNGTEAIQLSNIEENAMKSIRSISPYGMNMQYRNSNDEFSVFSQFSGIREKWDRIRGKNA